MKLTYEAHNNKYTIETQGDDVDMEEICQLIQQLLLSAGFQPETVKDYFGGEK
jgi:hypothetical protein